MCTGLKKITKIKKNYSLQQISIFNFEILSVRSRCLYFFLKKNILYKFKEKLHWFFLIQSKIVDLFFHKEPMT